MVYYEILNRVPCAIWYDLFHLFYIQYFVSTRPKFLIYPSFPFSFGTVSLFSVETVSLNRDLEII